MRATISSPWFLPTLLIAWMVVGTLLGIGVGKLMKRTLS